MKIQVKHLIILSIILILVLLGLADYLYFTDKFDLPFETSALDNLNNTIKERFFPPKEYLTEKGDIIYIDSPNLDKVHKCGLDIKGRVPAGWVFEGSFPIDLLDADDNLVQRVIATATEDWTQGDEHTAFEAEITCNDDCPLSGHLVFNMANPSDITIADRLILPVRFDPECDNDVEEIINVFWGNISIDSKLEHCEATYPYTRTVKIDEDPREYSLILLLAGPTEKESKLGCYTSIPNDVVYNSFRVEDGTAYVDLSEDIISKRITDCYKKMIRSQIENTLKQFADIDKVVISVDGEVDNELNNDEL